LHEEKPFNNKKTKTIKAIIAAAATTTTTTNNPKYFGKLLELFHLREKRNFNEEKKKNKPFLRSL
jgi:hypothetical protein